MAQPHSEPVICPHCSSPNPGLSPFPPGAEGPFQMECSNCHRSWPVPLRSLGAAIDPLARPLMPGRLDMAPLAEFADALTVCSGVSIRVVPETAEWTISTEWQSETLGAVLARLETVIAYRVIDGNTVELTPIRG